VRRTAAWLTSPRAARSPSPPARARILLVEDGFGPHPLAAVRAFAAAGWEVAVGSPQRDGRAVRSRWTARWHHIPPAERSLDRFLAATAAAVDAGRYALVFGGDDVEVLALSWGREQLGARVPYADHDAVIRSVDKLVLTEAARASGLTTPDTTLDCAARSLPVVVKARLHWFPGAPAATPRLPARLCHTRAEVAAAVAAITAAGGEPLLQRPVHGRLMALTGVMHGGRLLAPVQQLALRESPRWGNSTRAQTVPVDSRLVEQVEELLTGLGWFGLANLQFIRPPGERAHLTDLNGRFYGSMALALAAGVNHPVLWARLALSLPPGPLPPARLGVRYQILEEDLRRAVVERRGGLLPDVAGCLRYAPGAAHATWSLRDPAPAAHRAWLHARQSARSLSRKVGRSRRSPPVS